MDPAESGHIAHHPQVPSASRVHHEQNQESSTDSAATSTVEQSSSRKSSFGSAASTFAHDNQHQYTLRSDLEHKRKMTTYYCYEKDGTVTTSNLNPNAQVFTRGHSTIASYEERGDMVGAYLARRDMNYPAPAGQGTSHYHAPRFQPWSQPSGSSAIPELMERSHWSRDEQESSGYSGSPHAEVVNMLSYAGSASHSSIAQSYPDPEEIRHMHTLHSLLPYLQPERKMNALSGMKVDIVEQDTGVVLARQVPKKLLVMFLGRRVVNRYIRTLHRKNDEEWRGPPTCQEINLPRGKASRAAISVLISWMARACQYRTMNTVTQIHVPRSTFVACSLAQTMEVFDLHKDALRLDKCISQSHFSRPIFAVELETLWNCLDETSRYVYAAIKIVSKRIRNSESDSSRSVPGIDHEMYAMLKRHPRLEARVRDLQLNEQYRPTFNTDWTKKLVERKSDEGRHSSSTSDTFGKDLTMRDQNQSPIPTDVGHAMQDFESLRIVSDNEQTSMAGLERIDKASCMEGSNMPCDDIEKEDGVEEVY